MASQKDISFLTRFVCGSMRQCACWLNAADFAFGFVVWSGLASSDASETPSTWEGRSISVKSQPHTAGDVIILERRSDNDATSIAMLSYNQCEQWEQWDYRY